MTTSEHQRGERLLSLSGGGTRWQVHEERGTWSKPTARWQAGENRASGRGDICICLEAIRSREQCLDNSKYGSSLSPVQGRGMVRDDTGQVAVKERPCKQREGV